MLPVPSSTACSSAMPAPLACRLCAVRELPWATTALPAVGHGGQPIGGRAALGAGCAPFDEAPSAFVIMVGVMGENADRDTVL